MFQYLILIYTKPFAYADSSKVHRAPIRQALYLSFSHTSKPSSETCGGLPWAAQLVNDSIEKQTRTDS